MDELKDLCNEIRQYMIECCSVNPGHLGSSLGAVELVVGLHYVYDAPKDKIVWDVGHQSYTHKILTGRKEGFQSLRQYGGLSGFPKANESEIVRLERTNIKSFNLWLFCPFICKFLIQNPVEIFGALQI